MPESTTAAPEDFRPGFVYSGSREAIQAVVLFGFLFAVLLGVTLDLGFRQLSVSVLEARLDLGAAEARDIARLVSEVGRDRSGIDFSLVREREPYLREVIDRRLERRVFVHHVEVVDRFGIQQLLVSNAAFPHELQTRIPDLSFPEDWPKTTEQIVQWPLDGGEGLVRVGVSSQPILDELAELRSSLQLKVMLAAGLALAVLVAGSVYVFYLLRKNRRLEHARQSAARASYVGLLASGLAHEIRNPLNAMSMNLQMLEEELPAVDAAEREELTELLESTKSEIKRLESLVNNFLAYARPSRPRFEPRNLNDVIREVLKFLEVDFRQNGVQLRSDLEPLLPATELDETQFKQAMLNLLVNARQVLSAGGIVTVRTRAGVRGEAVVEVEDDGPGIPADMQERIFEVFYSSRGGGTGLGLPIARQVIERHGGTIELDSREGHGTRFTIRLPRHHERAADRPAAGSTATEAGR